MSQKIEFRARLVRYLGLDRPYRIELSGDSVRLERDHGSGVGSVTGPLSAVGGLVGALVGSLIDSTRQKNPSSHGTSSSTADQIRLHKRDFIKNSVSVSAQTMDAMIGNNKGEWRFRLASGAKYRFVFEHEAELNRAIDALSRCFGSEIKIKAKWNDKKKRFDPKGWLG